MATILHFPLPYPSAPRSFPTAHPAACRVIGRYVSPGGGGLSSNVVALSALLLEIGLKSTKNVDGPVQYPPPHHHHLTPTHPVPTVLARHHHRLLVYGSSCMARQFKSSKNLFRA